MDYEVLDLFVNQACKVRVDNHVALAMTDDEPVPIR